MGHDQVSGEASVLCWLAAPVAMFYGNLQKFGSKTKKKKSVSVETNPFPNLLLFYRTMLFEYPSVLSRFCLL